MRVARSVLAVVFVGLAALAAACGSGDDSTIGGELHILNWEDYFAPTTLGEFEAEFGVDVFLDTFEDEEEMLSVVESDPSRYDVIFASDATIGEMIVARLLAGLDLDNIPNLGNIDPAFLDQPWDPGNQHGVPYAWGSTGVIYNTKYLQPQEESWAVLQDPVLAGRVALDSDPFVVIGLALKSLGYSLNSRDHVQLDEAVALLREQRPLLAGFLDAITIRDRVISEELWAAQLYTGDAAFAIEENEDLAFFIPREGSDVYVDTMAVPRDARNKPAAELFINYILRPDVHAAIGDYTGYAVPNQRAVEQGLIDPEVLSDETVYPAVDLLEPWEIFDGEITSLWNKAWADIQRDAGASSAP
jgi:spermidine/putrescine transport system substrate-binding protein